MASIRRKKYIVERGLQFRFARFVILFVAGSCVFTGGAIFFTTFMLMGEKLANVYPQGRLVSIFQSVYLWAFVSLLGAMPFIFWGSIIFSHRIAGPLPKIYQALQNIGEGNYDIKLVLRKYDELRELSDHINETARKLKERDQKK
jgi:nitrate/nitrite-specific signal transduction histidine kinase